MNKTILFAILVISVLMLSGCGSKVTTEDGTTVTTTTTGKKTTQTVETDEGEQTTTVTVKDTGKDSWCPEGGEWEMASAGVQGEMEAEWRIDKLETSGEYEGLCHVIYTATGPQGDVRMDYWFTEDGESGYYEMEMAGQKIKQEWHADE